MNYNELIVRYSQFQILSEARDILFLQIVQTGSEVNPLSYSAVKFYIPWIL